MNSVSELTPELQEQLTAYSEAHGIPESEALRQAVDEFLRKRRRAARSQMLDETFGAWAGKDIDAVEFQRAIRAEWDRGSQLPANRVDV